MKTKLEIRAGFPIVVFEGAGCRGATPTEVELFALIASIQGALGTEETGDALVAVARNACRAEQELAALHREYDDGDAPTPPLVEGRVRKGGQNPPPQNFERPAPPPPFKPQHKHVPSTHNKITRCLLCGEVL